MIATNKQPLSSPLMMEDDTQPSANNPVVVVRNYETTTTTPVANELQLVHCVLKRVVRTGRFGSLSTTNKFLFSMQGKMKDDKEKLLLTAEKVSSHSYSIYNTSNKQHVGILSRVQYNLKTVTYALFDPNNVQIATFVYTVPNLSTIMSDKQLPPRHVQVAIMLKYNDDDINWCFESACKECIRNNDGNLDDLLSSPNSVIVLESKQPYKKSNGRVGLNFHGRGRKASPKNIQLTSMTDDEKHTVLCQMAKWDDHVYNMDYSIPLNPIHAFAFGLAQIDL